MNKIKVRCCGDVERLLSFQKVNSINQKVTKKKKTMKKEKK